MVKAENENLSIRVADGTAVLPMNRKSLALCRKKRGARLFLLGRWFDDHPVILKARKRIHYISTLEEP